METEREREREGERGRERLRLRPRLNTETETEYYFGHGKTTEKQGRLLSVSHFTHHCLNVIQHHMQHVTTDSQGSQNLYLSGDSDMSFLMSGSASGASRTTGRVCSSAPKTSKCM